MDELALPSPIASPLPAGQRLLSDERLARLVSRGDAQAFATLYARHHRALSRYCRAIVRDEHDAQDALQNAMMHALGALQQDERDLKVRPWLYRIVHNESVSLLRRRRVVEDLPVDEEIASLDGIEPTLELRERLALLVADLQTLSERQRAALVMRELSGLSVEEIADAFGISPGAAKQTLFEARCALHELAEGREMECDAVRRLVSEHDGRVLRGRRVRAHLRACAGCRAFRGSIETRSAELRALAPPLPLLGVAGLAGGGGGAGAAGHASAGPAGGALAGGSLGGGASLGGGLLGSGSLAVKALAGAALLTAASAGTVELKSGAGTHRAALSTPVARHAAAPAPAATQPLGSAPVLGGARVAAGRSARHRAGAESGAAAAGPGSGVVPGLLQESPVATAPAAGPVPMTAAPAAGSPGAPASSGSGDGGGSAPQNPPAQSPHSPPAQVPGQDPSGGHASPPQDPGPPATVPAPSASGAGAEHSHAGDAPDHPVPSAGPHGSHGS
jgi:RNA polymerase sigma factor (sigma-70 family)